MVAKLKLSIFSPRHHFKHWCTGAWFVTHPVCLQDPVIQKARVTEEDEAFKVSKGLKDSTAADLARVTSEELEPEDEDAEAEEAMRSAQQTIHPVPSTSEPTPEADKELHSFEIEPSQVRC